MLITTYVICAIGLVALAIYQYHQELRNEQRTRAEARREWALTPRPTGAPRKGALQ